MYSGASLSRSRVDDGVNDDDDDKGDDIMVSGNTNNNFMLRSQHSGRAPASLYKGCVFESFFTQSFFLFLSLVLKHGVVSSLKFLKKDTQLSTTQVIRLKWIRKEQFTMEKERLQSLSIHFLNSHSTQWRDSGQLVGWLSSGCSSCRIWLRLKRREFEPNGSDNFSQIFPFLILVSYLDFLNTREPHSIKLLKATETITFC